MRNRFKQWVRRLIMLSFASVGALASSAASAHDLPIFDTVGLSNCFGINSPNWSFEAGQADLARSFANPLRDPFAPFQDKSWNWCFADDFSIENTTPKLPETTRSAPQATDDFADRSDAELGSENQSTENHGTKIIPDWPEDCREFLEANLDGLESDGLGSDDLATDEFDATQSAEIDEDSCDELDYLKDSQDDSQQLNDETNGIPATYEKTPSDESASKDSYLAILNSSNIKLPSIDLQAALEQFSQSIQSAVRHIASIEPVIIAGEAEVAAIDEDTDRSEVEPLDTSTSDNYLRNRPLVDDYLDGESFVRDWRSLRPLSSSAHFDSLNIQSSLQSNLLSNHENSEELPQAIPAHANDVAEFATVVFAEIENLQCIWASETFHFDSVRRFSGSIATFDLGIGNSTEAAFQQLAKFWNQSEQQPNHLPEYAASDDFFGQPLFVIQQLDGKEFLLPAKQARHWNTVPMIAKQSIAPEKTDDSSIESTTAISSVARNLLQSASIGLDKLANQLHGIASNLRLSVEVDAQVANRGDDEDVR